MEKNNFVYVISNTNSTQILEVKENVVETLKSSPYNNSNLWIRTNNFCIPINLDSDSLLQYPEIVHSEKIKNFEIAFPSIQVFHDLSHDTKILYFYLKVQSQPDFDIKISINILPEDENLKISDLIQKLSEKIDIPITIKEISIGDNKFDHDLEIKKLFEQKSEDNFIALSEISDDILTNLINSRNSVLNQINDDEKNFISCLDKLINFWEPQISNLEIFIDDSEDPFQEIEQLFKLHKNLSDALGSHLNGFKTEFSPIFLYYSRLFNSSLKYLSRTSDFVLSVQNSLIFDETNEKLNELCSQCNNVSLVDYLKKPKEHYESYVTNLEKLQEVTPKWHPDMIYLPLSIKEIKSIVNQIKEKDDENLNSDEENDVQIMIDDDHDDDDGDDDDIMKLLDEEQANYAVPSPTVSNNKQTTDDDSVVKNLNESNGDSEKGKLFTSPSERRPSLKKMLDFEDSENTTPPSLKKMLDFGDKQNVEKLMSLINSSDDEESILTKIDEICSPRNKGRRCIDIDLNTIDPQPDVKDEYPKKGQTEVDKIKFSKSDINFLNGQLKEKKPDEKDNNKDNNDDQLKKSSNSLAEQSKELRMISNTKFVKNKEETDELPIKVNDLKPQGFRTNRPFNYRNFFNDREDSFSFYDDEIDSESSVKGEKSPKYDPLFEKFYSKSPYSEVYLHINHTRVVPKETPDEKRSIFASPRRRNMSLGFYSANNGIYSPEEQEKRAKKFASDLEQEDNVKYINQTERKRINSPKTEQRKPFKVGLFKSKANTKTVQVRKRHKSNMDILPKRYSVNHTNSTRADYKNRIPISRLNSNSNKANRERRLEKNENKVDDDYDRNIIKTINFDSPEKDDTLEDPIIIEEEEEGDDVPDINLDDNDNDNRNNIPEFLSFPIQIESPITIDSPIKMDGPIKIDSPMKFKK